MVRTELIAALSGLLIGFGDPLIKLTMVQMGLSDFSLFDIFGVGSLLLNWMFWIGMILAFLGTLIYIVALSRGKASIVNPLSGGFSYITIVLLSSLILGEFITIQKIMGMGIIIIGIYLLSLFYQQSTSDKFPAKCEIETEENKNAGSTD